MENFKLGNILVTALVIALVFALSKFVLTKVGKGDIAKMY